MKLYIKNMVCDRCIMVVKSELEKLGLQVQSVKLGEVELTGSLSIDQKSKMEDRLNTLGFELIDDKNSRTIEKIKTLIIDLVHRQDAELKTNLSTYLSDQLLEDYAALSSLFSEVENTTIEKFFIAQKIEKVKELLMYDELSLSEIAHKLQYSSVAYLSNQFKKVTGFTPSYFKKLKDNKRKQIDKL